MHIGSLCLDSVKTGNDEPKKNKKDTNNRGTKTKMLSDNDTMKLYMQNIGQYPLVNTEEEVELAA